MDKEFTNREIAVARLPRYQTVEGNKVSLRLRTKSLAALSVFFIAFVIISALLIVKAPMNWISFLVMGLLLLVFVIRYVDVVLKQRYYKYALREKDLIYERGYIVHKTTILPFNRIQHVAVSRSLFDKIFGLSSLKIYTAGGSGSDVAIPGLLPEMAEKLKEAVSKKVSVDDY